jgi:hypothetical protein
MRRGILGEDVAHGELVVRDRAFQWLEGAPSDGGTRLADQPEAKRLQAGNEKAASPG